MTAHDGHRYSNLFDSLRRLLARQPARTDRQRSLRVEIIDSPTERTTAATDAVLAALAAGCSAALLRKRPRNPWKAGLWAAAFGTLTLGATLGTVAHGFKMSPQTYQLLWQPLNLSLGVTIALFVTGVVYDTWGERAARRVLPLALLAAGGFFTFTLVRPGSYLVFVLYQSVGMLFALGVYSWLTRRRALPGAAWMTAGVLTTIIASALQASGRVSFTFIWQFDHNGVYHLVQMPGLLMLYTGLRAALQEQPQQEW